MTLHIVSSAPYQSPAFEDCLRYAHPRQDVVLLLGDAVYALRPNFAATIPSGFQVYALEHDIQTRGVSTDDSDANVVNAKELVTLSEQHSNSVTWA